MNKKDERTLEKETEEIDRIRSEFYSSIDKSENDLERKITYISAGGLALSLGFLEKIVNLSSASYFFIIIVGWLCLALTLSINLISILTSRKLTMKSLEDFDSNISDKDFRNNIAERNKKISKLDQFSLVSLLLGIALIIVFCSINLFNKKEVMPDKDRIEKGRIIQSPRPSTNQENQGTRENSGNNSDSSSSDGSNPDKK